MVPKGDPRESKFTMLLSDEEREMLSELANEGGLSAAMWLRQLIHGQHRKLLVDPREGEATEKVTQQRSRRVLYTRRPQSPQ